MRCRRDAQRPIDLHREMIDRFEASFETVLSR